MLITKLVIALLALCFLNLPSASELMGGEPGRPLQEGESSVVIPSPKKVVRSNDDSPVLRLGTALTIVFDSGEAREVADVFAKELIRLFGENCKISTAEMPSKPGDIILQIVESPDFKEKQEAYRLKVDQQIHVQASDRDGLLAGTASLLQLFDRNEDQFEIQKLEIEDFASRSFRSMMVDVKNQWHSLDDLKRFVDLCRFYKVRHLSLHTGEAQWIGAICEQTARIPSEERAKLRLYTKAEMDELISYGKERGVYLFPHNECTPHFGHMIVAMKEDHVADDQYAGFADELDGEGSFEQFDGKVNDRWLKLMEIAKAKSIQQFAAGYPNGKLPYYHIGPVLGEGGMDTELAARFIQLITSQSPETKIMFWNGPAANDANLLPLKDRCIVAYYDDEFGRSDLKAHLEQGWMVANSAWSPLYIVGNQLGRPVERIFMDYHLWRQGSDGVPGGYRAIQWEKIDDKILGAKIVGGQLCTWETAQAVHLNRLRIRIPAFVEHVWNEGEWPYAEADFQQFAKRLEKNNRRLSAFLNEPKLAPGTPMFSKASIGMKGKVQISWKAGGGTAPSGFRVLRTTSLDNPDWRVAADNLPAHVEQIVDEVSKTDTPYFYCVEAFNDYGTSKRAEPVRGSASDGVARINCYEPFDYRSTEQARKNSRGEGWQSAWRFKNGEPLVSFVDEGLSYEGLSSTAGAIRVSPINEEEGYSMERSIDGQLGVDETTAWMSYLVRADKVGNGDVFVLPNGETTAATGKVWGDQFSIYLSRTNKQIEVGKTYLVVTRIDFGDGDKISLWINPDLNREPDSDDADMQLTTEIGNRNTLEIRGQGHGLGRYVLDEIRIGTTWAAVGGRVNPDDRTPPNPSPLTWTGPPSVQEDGSIFMKSATAEDISGVQYFFECVEGGGPSSGWLDQDSFVIKNPTAGKFSYRVKARDLSVNRNETEWSFAGTVEVEK